jgi:hypothetical protein
MVNFLRILPFSCFYGYLFAIFRFQKKKQIIFEVFPTPVGVFLFAKEKADNICKGLPHARGGVSPKVFMWPAINDNYTSRYSSPLQSLYTMADNPLCYDVIFFHPPGRRVPLGRPETGRAPSRRGA